MSLPPEDSRVMEPRIHYVTTDDGVSIAWASSGTGSPPVVVLPWLPWSHAQLCWRSQFLPGILARRLPTKSYDSRGSGLSQREVSGFTLAEMVLDLHAVVVESTAAPANLVAFDDGCAVAVAFAAQFPDRVASLVLANPWSHYVEIEQRRGFDLFQRMEGTDWDLFTRAVARMVVGLPDSLSDGFAEYIRASTTPQAISSFVHSLRNWDVSKQLADVAATSLVVYSAGHLSAEASARRVAAGIPTSSLARIDGGLAMFEQIADHVVSFLGPEATTSSPSLLSPRQTEVLRLLSTGRTNGEIAATLGVSLSTVDRHVANIYSKANVHNRAEATLWAVANGIVSAPAT